MKPYSYNCIDKSILLPYFKKYYIAYFYKIVPRGLTANFITLISTGFIVALLLAAIYLQPFNSVVLAILMAICLHNYVVGDHLDGMQAKETKTSSPLGEYMDHYLDVYNGAIVVYVLTVFFAPIPNPIFYLFLFLNAISFAVTMVEELERQELVFGILGTLEGLIVLILFFLTWLLAPVRDFWTAELYAGYARYWIIILFFGLGYIGTLIDVIHRIGYIPRQFILFVIVAAMLAFNLYKLEFSQFGGWILITLFSGEYISKVMESYLIGKVHKYPDPVFCSAIAIVTILIIGEFTPSLFLSEIMTGLGIYIATKTVFLFFSVIYQLRSHWLWINPSP